MENLEVACYESFKYDQNITGPSIKASVQENMCCFLTNSNRLIICELRDNMKTFLLEVNVSNSVIEVKYLNICQVIFIATQTNLIIYEPSNEKLTVIHSFTNKITQTSWNPNETFLVVVDEKNVLYGFTLEVNPALQQYHFIETHTSQLDCPVPNSVYVGWGSHSTQFQGAKKKDRENIQEVFLQYSPPQISWRGNGEQLAINFWRNYRRSLKVFDCYLRPLFQSEAFPNLLAPTSFKGQGNFIACAALHNEHNKIVIFEKNCLMKSEFIVPENKGHIKSLQYHPDMHILAVFSEDTAFNGYLNIYVNFNAKWYLKQQLYYPFTKKMISFNWVTFLDKNMCTLIILTSEAVERLMFRAVNNRYPENSLVAVIDGATVHFTKFSEQIVPPPMSTLSLNFPKPVNRIFFDHVLNLYQFLTSDDGIHPYLYENGEFKRHSGKDLPQIEVDVNNTACAIIYKIETTINNNHYEFLLDKKQDLLINRSVVCNNVLSMYIHEIYLLFTHVSCKLYCVRLIPENLFNFNWKLDKFYSREVEQGAKIVCITDNSDIVLQVPRGNLETVSCRVIAIDIVETLLAQNKWKEAIYQIRKERLNWNLVIDLKPQRFADHIKDFIEAAGTVPVLNTIVSEFSNEDCLQTTYRQCIESDRAFSDYDKTQVFSRILDQIVCVNPLLNLISIVTLQAKHFTLKCALRSVCAVFEMGELDICKKAIFHILLYSHVKNVVRESYTLYNLGFMKLIFTCCCEDPRVFEPELEKLLPLEPADLRFKMNVLGQNFKGATKYLIRCPQYDEKYIAEFITTHVTQITAYESIEPNHPNFKLISRLFAVYLGLRGRHNEAGLILEKAELHKEALEEYKRGLNWPRVVSLLETLKTEECVKKELLFNLANELVMQKKIDEAVLLYEHHCGLHERAIEVLLESRMFQKALSLASKYDFTDLTENVIKPAIVKHRTDLYERITELGNQFLNSTARLQLVRQKKLNSFKHAHLEDEAFENDDLHSEYGSLISSRGSSAGSRSSKGSTASSRNRRKQEKKKTDLREGGVYEDIALIRQLYMLAIDIFKCGQEVQNACMILTDHQSFNYCTKLHEKLSIVQDSVKSNIGKIWSDTFLNAPLSSEPEILAVVRNREELDPEFRKPPSSEMLQDNWKLLIFSKKG